MKNLTLLILLLLVSVFSFGQLTQQVYSCDSFVTIKANSNAIANWDSTITGGLIRRYIDAKTIEVQIFMDSAEFIYRDASSVIQEKITVYSVNNQPFVSHVIEGLEKVGFYPNYTTKFGTETTLFFGDGNSQIVDLSYVVHTYPRQTEYEYCLVMENSFCPAKSVCKVVNLDTLSNNCTASFGYYHTDSMQDSTRFYTELYQNRLYYWDFGDGTAAYQTNPTHHFERNGVYTVTLYLSDSTGCNDSYQQEVIIGTNVCKADFDYSNRGDSVFFYNKSYANAGSDYYWDLGNNNVSYSKHPEGQKYVAGTYYVSLTVRDSDNYCVSNVKYPIIINSTECIAHFDYSYNILSDSVKFFPSQISRLNTSSPHLTYTWSFGDGGGSNQAAPSYQFSYPGYNYAGLTVFDSVSGCRDNYSQYILTGNNIYDLEAEFDYFIDDTSKTVFFYNTSLGTNFKSVWSFGDRSYSEEFSPYHTYISQGYYEVCLTISDSLNGYNSNISCKTIFTGLDNENYCRSYFYYTVPDSGKMKAEFISFHEGDVTEVLWDFGDGSTSDQDNPSHLYANSGFYFVSLIASNPATGCESRYYDVIAVNEEDKGLVPGFGFKLDSLEENNKSSGYPVDFVGAAFGDPAKISWDFGDGEVDSSSFSTTHFYQSEGQYYACFTVSDPNSSQEPQEICKEVNVYNLSKNSISKKNNELNVFPNPANSFLHVEFQLDKQQNVNITVYNIIGSKVKEVSQVSTNSGKNSLRLNLLDLESGIYFIELSTLNGKLSKKFSITK